LTCLFFTFGQSQWLETTITVDSGPCALIWNSTNNKVYCANYGSNNVTVIDGVNDSVITTIPVGTGPWALVWNSANNKVYCANTGTYPNYDSTITVIDGVNDSAITTIPVRRCPKALVWNSTNNKVYCANYYSNNVTVIDGANDSVITIIPGGDLPRALAWNSANNKVYCANTSANVTVIEGTNDSVITTISVGEYPLAFCWNSIQNRVYVANYWGSSISVIRDEIPGIEERIALNAERFMPEIFPNPARSYLAIRLPQTADRLSMKIFDVTGKEIREIATPSARNDKTEEVRISLKGINPGIYFLQVGKEVKKFLVIK